MSYLRMQLTSLIVGMLNCFTECMSNVNAVTVLQTLQLDDFVMLGSEVF